MVDRYADVMAHSLRGDDVWINLRDQALSRRSFVAGMAALGSGAALAGGHSTAMQGSAAGASPARQETQPQPEQSVAKGATRRPLFPISLAQWSLHRTIRSGALDPAAFPQAALRDYGIDAVEYVNTFLMKGDPKERVPQDAAWFADLRRRCDDLGVRSVLIMCDGLGALGAPQQADRLGAVERHRPWLEIANGLGCHSIRVNAASQGSWEEQRSLAADGLRRLCELADPLGLNVIVENHGGLSSNGKWLAETIRAVGHPRAGTLPDFGNFDLGGGTWYDRYEGVAELMPFAKGVSAKSHDFDDEGGERFTDYRRMLGIVLDAGYRDWIGVEYEGSRLSEPEGIRATKALLERVRSEREGASSSPSSSGVPGGTR